jgi:hypothetical protein
MKEQQRDLHSLLQGFWAFLFLGFRDSFSCRMMFGDRLGETENGV